MPDFAQMSDEQVHQEWQDTRMRFASLSPGVEPPRYTPEMAARHVAAEAELIRRGYVEQTPGWWVGPDNQTF
jgi:hypothetical protein